MDTEWLAARTSYAVAVHYPNNCRHFEWSCYSDNSTGINSFYDCVTGIKRLISNSNPTDNDQRESSFSAMRQILQGLSDDWNDPLDRASRDPEVLTTLHGHFTALLDIISPKQHGLPIQSLTDTNSVYDFFLGICLAETGISQTLSGFQLQLKVRRLFECSNIRCIRPPLSLSARRSLSHRRDDIKRRNPSWMQDKSREWTRTLSEIIQYSQKIIPQQPFAQNCTGSSAHPCGSNLHTDSIVELTEFVLIFQVTDDIHKICDQLSDLISSKQRPVQDAPFVLMIACAYINAIANVNLNRSAPEQPIDIWNNNGSYRLLHIVCNLCGSLDSTVEPRLGGTGKHWPKMESAFDYIRRNCLDESDQGATEMPPAPDVPDSVGSDENV